MPIPYIKSKDDLDLYISQNDYVMINFTASWCGPCKAVAPILEQLYSDPEQRYNMIEVVKVDLDSQQEVCRRYEVTSVPTFVFIEKGKETSRTVGGNIPEIKQKLDALREKAPEGLKRKERGTPVKIADELKKYISGNYEILNSTVHTGGFEALNAISLYANGDLRDTIKQSTKKMGIISDADAQLLLHVPLMNISKVYSILLKLKKPEYKQEYVLDEEDYSQETQFPSVVKVWANHTSLISFDDAASDNNPGHIEKIGEPDENGWYECRLKFVRFQKTQSLTIFVDGDDEDLHTLIDEIVIVGLSGEAKEQPTLLALEED